MAVYVSFAEFAPAFTGVNVSWAQFDPRAPIAPAVDTGGHGPARHVEEDTWMEDRQRARIARRRKDELELVAILEFMIEEELV